MAKDIIRTLSKVSGKPVDYFNQIWLEENVEKLKIAVCVSKCLVDIFGVVENWKKEGHICVQKGKVLKHRSEFNIREQALSLIPYDNYYMVFIYIPPEKEDKKSNDILTTY